MEADEETVALEKLCSGLGEGADVAPAAAALFPWRTALSEGRTHAGLYCAASAVSVDEVCT